MALAAINPSYATLQITQKPSWVRPPSSYTHGSASSLSVAFEDPDGTKMKALLTERYLYAFGNRCSVKKWKYRLNKPKDNSNNTAEEHNQDSDSNHEEELRGIDMDNPFSPGTPRQPLDPDNPCWDSGGRASARETKHI